MKTIITLQDKTVIQTDSRDVTPIATSVKITTKTGTQAMREKERIENAISNRIDRHSMRVQRAVNQREARRAKR